MHAHRALCPLDRFGCDDDECAGCRLGLGGSQSPPVGYRSTDGRHAARHPLPIARPFVVVGDRGASGGRPHTRPAIGQSWAPSIDIRAWRFIQCDSVAGGRGRRRSIDLPDPSCYCMRQSSSTADNSTDRLTYTPHSLPTTTKIYRGWCSRAHSKMGKVIRSKWLCVWRGVCEAVCALGNGGWGHAARSERKASPWPGRRPISPAINRWVDR